MNERMKKSVIDAWVRKWESLSPLERDIAVARDDMEEILGMLPDETFKLVTATADQRAHAAWLTFVVNFGKPEIPQQPKPHVTELGLNRHRKGK